MLEGQVRNTNDLAEGKGNWQADILEGTNE